VISNLFDLFDEFEKHFFNFEKTDIWFIYSFNVSVNGQIIANHR